MDDRIESALRREPDDIPKSLPQLELLEKPSRHISLGRPLAPVGAVLVSILGIVVLLGLRQVAGDLGSGHPGASGTASPGASSAPSAGAESPASPSPTQSTWRFVEGASTRWPVDVTLVDQSGLVTTARALAPFEFVPAPKKPGEPFAFNSGPNASVHVGIIWFGDRCDTSVTATIDRLARSIKIVRTEGHTCSTVLFSPITRGIVVEFSKPIDADQFAVAVRLP